MALTACIIAGLIHFALGSIIQNIRFMFPPLVTGLVILAIGLYLIPVAIKYSAGGAAEFQMNAESFGSLMHWSVALTVVVVSLICKFMTKGLISNAAVLIGLIAGYIVAILMGMVSFGGVAKSAWFQIPEVMPYGFEFSLGAVIGVTLVSIVSAIETVGDTSATTKAGAGRDATDEEIYKAATLSHCDEFINNLPEKYETLIGEDGVRLSGGEKQRISIARAMLKKSSIILLDEATSSLDSETETKIQDALKILTKDKTTIVIAHRLSTILNSNKIYVIDSGKIIDNGKHEDLLINSKIYKNFHDKQFQR